MTKPAVRCVPSGDELRCLLFSFVNDSCPFCTGENMGEGVLWVELGVDELLVSFVCAYHVREFL